MGFLDLSVYIIVGIFYNLFIHQLTSTIYKELPFEEKYNKSITFIFICGILGIVISRLINKKNDKKKSVVSTGLMFGGILLMLTSIFANWDNMTDEIKLCLSGVGFVIVIWYFYFYYDKDDNRDHNRDDNSGNENKNKEIYEEKYESENNENLINIEN